MLGIAYYRFLEDLTIFIAEVLKIFVAFNRLNRFGALWCEHHTVLVELDQDARKLRSQPLLIVYNDRGAHIIYDYHLIILLSHAAVCLLCLTLTEPTFRGGTKTKERTGAG